MIFDNRMTIILTQWRDTTPGSDYRLMRDAMQPLIYMTDYEIFLIRSSRVGTECRREIHAYTELSEHQLLLIQIRLGRNWVRTLAKSEIFIS